jgi:hypothetical protein
MKCEKEGWLYLIFFFQSFHSLVCSLNDD